MRPSENNLMLASIALIELAESRTDREGEAFREVADYLLRLLMVRAVRASRESEQTNSGGK